MARTRKGLVIKVIYKDSRTGVKSDVCDWLVYRITLVEMRSS